jgi:phage/plasmid primase-like uncharacterized protein
MIPKNTHANAVSIKQALNANIPSLLAALGIAWDGRGQHIRCPLPTHNDRNPSFRWDNKRQAWFCSCGGGDVIALIQGVLSLSFKDALKWASQWLYGDYQPSLARTPVIPLQNATGAAFSVNENKERALKIWKQAKPLAGTLAERYLQEHRGITLNPLPPSLRFHPRLYHKDNEQHFPALVAAIQAPDRAITAVHRIFLDGTTAAKANVPNPKLTLGSMNGGAVRLAAAGETLILCEGLEDGLTLLQATGLPTWATLGTAGLKGVVLPDTVKEAIIAADGDEAGQKAAIAAAERFTREGREVRIATPPQHHKDFNALKQKDLVL